MAPYAAHSPGQLLTVLTEHLSPRRLPGWVPAERLLPALRAALIAPDVGSLRALRGARLVATDLRFAAGIGPQVRGPAEALLMTIAGQPRTVMSGASGSRATAMTCGT